MDNQSTSSPPTKSSPGQADAAVSSSPVEGTKASNKKQASTDQSPQSRLIDQKPYTKLPPIAFLFFVLSELLGLVIAGILFAIWAWVIPAMFQSFPTSLLPPFLGGHSWAWLISAGFALFVISNLFSLLISRFTYLNWGYVIAQDYIATHKGVLTKTAMSVPRNRIQSVEVSRGPLQRLLHVASVTVYTAGVRAPELSIPVLEYSAAHKLKEMFGKEIEERERADGDVIQPAKRRVPTSFHGTQSAKRKAATKRKRSEESRSPSEPAKPIDLQELPDVQRLEPEMTRSTRWYTAPVSQETQNSWKALTQQTFSQDAITAEREQKAREEQIRIAQLRAQQARMGVLSANAGDEEFNKIAEQELDGSIAGGESPVLVPPISTDERQQRKWQHSQWGVVFSEDAVEETGPQLFLDQSQFSHPELHAKPAATYAATNSTDSPDIAGSTAAGASSFAVEKDSFTVDGSYGYEDIPLTTPGAADADSSRASYREHNPVEDNTSSYGYDLAANIDDDDDDDEDDGAFTLTSNLDT